mgnify:CR=1 FL=1
MLDMMERPNVCHLMGNHDLMALDILKVLSAEIREDNLDILTDKLLTEEISEWINGGGDTTLKQFTALSKEKRADLLDYISDFSLYEVIDAGNKT